MRFVLQAFLVLTLSLILVDGATRKVSRNNDVTLTCSKKSTDGPVWWDKQSTSGTQTLSIDNTLQAGVDAGKYTVEALGQTFALTVRNVQPSDDGSYRCFNLFGEGSAEVTELTIQVPPSPVNVTGADVAVSEGSLIELMCISENGKPKPTLRWSKKGAESTELSATLKETSNPDGTFTVTKTLTLAIGRASAGDIYLCTATITDIPYNETKEVPLTVNLKPLAPVLSGKNETDENSLFSFTCLSAFGRPAATIVWYRGPASDPKNETLVGNEKTSFNSDGSFNLTSTMSFKAKYTDDQKQITCSTTNVVLQNLGQNPQTISDVITVNYKPVVTVPNTTLSVDEGNALLLPCNVQARPTAQITWTHNVKPINASDGSFADGTSQAPSLVIVSASASHVGVYQCAAANRLGTTTGALINLNVRHAPVITMGPGSVTSVREGNNVILHCHVTANPPELDFIKWYRNNVEINVNSDQRLSGGNTTLTISATNRTLDAGQYKCRAKNVIGQREGNELKLEVQYPPEGVTVSQDIVNVDEGNSPPNVTCNSDAIPSATYQWHHDSTGMKQDSSAVLDFPTITGRDFGDYTCQSTNKWGSANGTVFMNVSFTPYCKPGQKVKYGAKIGVPVQITCSVLANPTTASFDVTLGSNSIWQGSGTSSGYHSASVSGVFSYTPKSNADFGTLACNASNSMGALKKPCNIEVVPAGPSEAPSSCQVKSVTESSINVVCVEGFDGGSTQRFALQTKTGSVYETKLNTTVASFTLSQLTKGTPYTLRVCSSNTDFPDKQSCTAEFKATTKGETSLEGNNGGISISLSQSLCIVTLSIIMHFSSTL